MRDAPMVAHTDFVLHPDEARREVEPTSLNDIKRLAKKCVRDPEVQVRLVLREFRYGFGAHVLDRHCWIVIDGGRSRRLVRVTPNYWNTPQAWPVIDRRSPGPGYRHVVKKKDIERFIGILPDWHELARGLDAIILATGNEATDGWHRPGRSRGPLVLQSTPCRKTN